MVLLMVLCTMLPFLLFSLFLTLVNCCLFRMHTMAFYFSSFPYVFLGHASLSPLPRYTFCQTNNQLKNFNILNVRNKIVSFQSIVMLTLLIFLTHFGVIYLETQLYRKKPMITRLWFLCRKHARCFQYCCNNETWLHKYLVACFRNDLVYLPPMVLETWT